MLQANLRLSENRLERLPEDELGKMGQLQVLKLDNNNLVDIPDSVGELEMLRELDVSNNCLSSVPDAIQHASSMERLRASSNKIRALPDLSGLQRMKDLCIRGAA